LFTGESPTVPLGIGKIVISSVTYHCWYCLPICLVLAYAFASLYTPKGAFRGKQFVTFSGLDPFIAIRPIASSSIVGARILVAMRSSVYATAVMLVGVAILLVTSANESGTFGSLVNLLASHISVRGLLLTALVVGLVSVLIWSVQCVSMAVGELPEKYRKVTGWIPVAAYFAWTACELSHFSTDRDSLAIMMPSYIAIGFMLALVKFFLALYLSRQVSRLKLLPATTIIKCVGLWVLAAGLLTAALYFLLPAGAVPLAAIALAVSLLLPASTILWQIIGIDRRRHLGVVNK